VKRSEVNRVIAASAAAFADRSIYLPPFASWSPAEWARRGSDVLEILEAGLGWDVVEWKPGRFDEHGLVLLTLRNVAHPDARGRTDGYAEKLLHIRRDQQTPIHCHLQKMEDIINRGGGRLIVELLADPDVPGKPWALVNGRTVRAVTDREVIVLTPGESITLIPGVRHAFHASGDDVVAGEVSTYNDDRVDNHFVEPIERFPDLEEDTDPARLIVADYPELIDSIKRRTRS